jgi:hypothetical protein
MLWHSKDAVGDAAYDRHQPEQTLLYQHVEAHYPALINHRDATEEFAGRASFVPGFKAERI